MFVHLTSEEEKTEYTAKVVEVAEESLVISAPVANGRAFEMKRNDRYHLQIVVDNVLYNWNDMTLTVQKDGNVRIAVIGKPSVINRRKYPRMPMSNSCVLHRERGENCQANLVNISANGFAFMLPASYEAPEAKQHVRLTVENFAHIDPVCVLEGTVIRCSTRDGHHVIGCRMPADNQKILRYVKENYSGN